MMSDDAHSRFDAIADVLARRSSDLPFLLLDPNLRIRAASTAYVSVALRERDELCGELLFDAFPDNPGDPQASGTANLAASLETAMRSGRPHNMWIQRYDIRDPDSPDTFLPKVWSPANAPLVDHGELIGVVHRVKEVAGFEHLVSVLARALETGRSWSSAELLHTLAAVTEVENDRHSQRERALVVENEQLRVAIDTRDMIGQAKGMLMERFNIDSVGAFDLLVKLSQDTNIRVEQIARKVVEAQRPPQSN
ncbi:histidine kinase [Mycobacterium angelicum]|uniref:Histidine kinase n=2 Tax=Mycobacterium angelicum TaxID=470074 RepID=A0A1X0A723_MYCAN|nr:ANTAR domain-containing protein [Mycobacterium angelicum]MCV7195046.1 ANTAR domain-containing protein [Mycobacterium angelicum]ORA25867.1 histidine kinase [Mycobacterium angelicum]